MMTQTLSTFSALSLTGALLFACAPAESEGTIQERTLPSVVYFNCDDSGCVRARAIDPEAPLHAICDSTLCTLRGHNGERDLFHDEIAAATAAQLRTWDAQLAAAGGGEYPWGGRFDEPVILDPYCAMFDFYGEPCPDNGGGGGGSGGGGGGGGGGHQGDLECTACSLSFVACAAGCPSAGLLGALICMGGCGVKFVKCARAKCND